jgi:membrane-associated protease RseP (regulator of RpoE activity)
MKSQFSMAIAGRRLLLFCGLGLMGVSMAMAQIGAEGQPENRTKQPNAGQREPREAAGQPRTAERQPREAGQPRTERREPAADSPARTDREPRERTDEARSREEGRGERRSLGLRFGREEADGLTIETVEQGGFAAQAGLRAGDRIVSVDGRPIRSGRMFSAYLSGLGGRRVPVIIEREGRQMTAHLSPPMADGQGPWLGVFLQQGEDNARGATVTHVYPAGPAARAGVRSGDVIVAVDGKQVAGPAELIETIDGLKAGAKTEITVLRGDREVPLAATLVSRESFIYQPRREFNGDENLLEPGQEERWAQEHQHDDFYDIPEYAMELEAHRRLAEQHERIEHLIQQLRGEVQALREELKTRR